MHYLFFARFYVSECSKKALNTIMKQVKNILQDSSSVKFSTTCETCPCGPFLKARQNNKNFHIWHPEIRGTNIATKINTRRMSPK